MPRRGRNSAEPLASALEGDGLDEAVAALRTFALLDRETIADEREPAITTDTIRLHRLVRQVAAARREGEAREEALRALIEAMAAVYPNDVFDNPRRWPRARRLMHSPAIWVTGMATAGECANRRFLEGQAASRPAPTRSARPL